MSLVSAIFSPDGRRVVSTSEDKTARVWNAATGEAIGKPLRHESGVASASFSPDGTRVVTVSEDKTARVWNAATGEAIGKPLRHEGGVASASFSPDGMRVVTASKDKTARVWDAGTGQPIGTPMRHESGVGSARFSPDGTRVVTASWDKTARVWDAATGQAIGTPMRHKNDVSRARFSPDGTRVVTSSEDKTARVWDAASGQRIADGQLAESLAFLCAHARLDQQFGTLTSVMASETRREWPKLEQELADHGLSDWLFVLQSFKNPSPITRCSLRSTATIREVATVMFTSGEGHLVREAGSVDPGNPLLPLAFAGLEVGDVSESATQRARFLQPYGLARLPADAVLAAKAAEMLERQRQPDLARQAWARAAETTPADTDATALRAFGQALRKLDRLAESVAAYNKGAQRFPKNAGILVDLAVTQWLANDHDAAVATFRRLVEENRQWADPEIIANLRGFEGGQEALKAVRAETFQRHPELAPAARRR